MSMIVMTILPFLPLAVWVLLVGWSANRTEGEELLLVPVPLLARLKMLSTTYIVGILFLIIGLVAGKVSWWVLPILLALYVLLLAIPTSYTLTTAGIRTGKGRFRRWTEFAGVRRSPFGAMLVGGQKQANYPIYLSGGREDDDFVLTLKNLVRNSYKGIVTGQDRFVRDRPDDQDVGETNTTSSINH